MTEPRTKHARLINAVRQVMLASVLRPGDQLPPEQESANKEDGLWSKVLGENADSFIRIERAVNVDSLFAFYSDFSARRSISRSDGYDHPVPSQVAWTPGSKIPLELSATTPRLG